jgi:chemotaxis protein methyltransferase CheR
MSSAKKLVLDSNPPATAEMVDILTEKALPRSHYDFYANKMYEYSGVSLPFSSKNEALVKNRLTKLMRIRKITSFVELRKLMEEPDAALKNDFISALTTNKTHFFREDAHFDFLKDFFRNHFKNHSDLRIWCAAASTGQEPYTIAMLMRENLSEDKFANCKFLATDIDLQVLAKAAKGEYLANELDGLPDYLRVKYFERIKGAKEDVFRATDAITSLVRFAPMNLIQSDFGFKYQFDIVFCRNVLIYFDAATTKEVIQHLANVIKKDGYLVLGHSESGTVKIPQLKALTRAIYQRI